MPPVAEVYDMGYFRNVDISRHYKEHNIALKWFRDVCEREGRSVKRFSNTEAEMVAQINHPKGTAFTFDE